MTSNGLDLLTRVIGTASGSGGSDFRVLLIMKSVRWYSTPGSLGDTRLCSPRIRAWKLNSLNGRRPAAVVSVRNLSSRIPLPPHSFGPRKSLGPFRSREKIFPSSHKVEKLF